MQPILDGEADVVYGSRFLAGRPPGPWLSVAANRVLTGLTNVLYGAADRHGDLLQDHGAPVARSLQLESNRFDIEPEITAKLLRAAPHRRAADAFDPRTRAQGKKIGWRDGVRAIQVLLKYRFQQITRLRQGYGGQGKSRRLF